MKPEQIAEGRRLKAAANEALEMGEHVSVRDAQKAVDAWDRWLDGNMDALLDAAERAEAAERELSEAREGLQAGLAALTPFAHKDLCKALGGNAEGDTSRIFVRNSAVITLGDCRRARAIVVASETAADAAAIDS